MTWRQVVRALVRRAGVDVIPVAELEALRSQTIPVSRLALLADLPPDQLVRLLPALAKSKSQLGQDLFALSAGGFRREGFFVEFGATNGVDLSNTWLLEHEYGWRGVLAEPARSWHAALRAARRAAIDTRCVWTTSGSRLSFKEAAWTEVSTLERFATADGHSSARRGGRTYEVETVSLVDLLATHQAPAVIDYLSIDTEGSEYDILAAHDFSRYRFRVITVEHNRMPVRERLFTLLTGHGYRRVLEAHSRYDDWYVDQASTWPAAQ